jgi:hypothetical protein
MTATPKAPAPELFDPATQRARRLFRRCAAVHAAVLAGLAVYLLILPGATLMRELTQPDLYGPAIPSLAWRLHRTLTPRLEPWARERIAAGTAAHLALNDVPSTEWPLFGSVFYLMATEALQQEWERNPSSSPTAPAVYARDAIEACTTLVTDPVHHTWVRQHWGDDYLHRQNVFFRGLLIAGLTSYQRLTGSTNHLALLRDQAQSLSGELNRSRFGILDDYPDECYPIDVLASIAFIRRSDDLTGLDHSAFVARARRAFEPPMTDEQGMVPYVANPVSGEILDSARGTGNSWILMFAHDLWPDLSARWYEQYERHFWQRHALTAGWREWPLYSPKADSVWDVDAGPIIAGYSPAANAFGVGAARFCGRLDQARILTPQVLAACWPLPDGTLLGARILSSATHAPYLGESALLYFLTRTPAAGVPVRTGGATPRLLWIAYAFFFGGGILVVYGALGLWGGARAAAVGPVGAAIRLSLWLLLATAAAVQLWPGHFGLAALAFLAATFCFSATRRRHGKA